MYLVAKTFQQPQHSNIVIQGLKPARLTVLATGGLIDGSGHGDCGDGRG